MLQDQSSSYSHCSKASPLLHAPHHSNPHTNPTTPHTPSNHTLLAPPGIPAHAYPPCSTPRFAPERPPFPSLPHHPHPALRNPPTCVRQKSILKGGSDAHIQLQLRWTHTLTALHSHTPTLINTIRRKGCSSFTRLLSCRAIPCSGARSVPLPRLNHAFVECCPNAQPPVAHHGGFRSALYSLLSPSAAGVPHATLIVRLNLPSNYQTKMCNVRRVHVVYR